MRLARLIVTVFFIGYARIAPGTVASILTILIFYMFAKYLVVSLLITMIIVSIILAFIAIRSYTSDYLEKDKSEIVIDEVIGQTIAAMPLLLFPDNNSPEFYKYLIALLLFRFFDVLKPYPINKFDKMNNAFGILMDDIIAGFFSAVLLTLILIL